jgi:hypothetical protein
VTDKNLEASAERVADALNELVNGLAESFIEVMAIAAAQEAMGWAYRGDMDKVKTTLSRLKPDALYQLRQSAIALLVVSDMVINEKPEDHSAI